MAKNMKLIALACAASLGSAQLSGQEGGTAKVLELLNTIKTELETEGKSDDDVNTKMNNWCGDEDRDKNLAINMGKDLITQLESIIHENTLDSKRLATELTITERILSKNQESLESATSQHTKTVDETDKAQADMDLYIKQLKRAEVKLTKLPGSKPAFLSMEDNADIKDAVQLIKTIQEKFPSRLAGSISKHQALPADLGADLSLLGGPMAPGEADKDNQNNKVKGIITGMKEQFERDFAESEKAEAAARETFAGLETSKKEEIAAVEAQILSKNSQKAQAEENAAQSTENLGVAKKDLASNEQFLGDVTAKCKVHKKEYKVRADARKTELAAVVEALKILSTPAAADLFGKTFKTEGENAFLQIQSSAQHEDKAKALVSEAKAVVKSIRSGVTKEKLDGFERVKKAIEKLHVEITDKKLAEVKKRDSCTDRVNKNNAEVTKYTRDTGDKETLKAKIKKDIEEVTALLESEAKAIKDLTAQLKNADEEREKQKDVFIQTVKDQQATQKVLKNAIVVLEREYNKNALLQKKVDPVEQPDQVGAVKPPTPEEFAAMEPNRKSKSVLGLIHLILKDAENLEESAKTAEETAIEDYKQFSKDTKATVQTKKLNIVAQESNKGNAERALFNAKSDIFSLKETLESLEQTKATLGEECNFLLDNFTVRQEAFAQELKALTDAKSILSGANLGLMSKSQDTENDISAAQEAKDMQLLSVKL
eukprot:TRINITY_DN2302_c0_g1_i2.p1 TRINITY_DN2302_c0_g1~~TRINITY_DN2302_c0_g1_i2.p1  ORF type:complete len:715 (+),score=258.38 TRINITY_DN2302_c0_g1_i2:111-2255(+)